jgi:hypothetical protein
MTGVDFSDHRNYWHFDIPAVMVTDTAFFRNPHYHQLSDTAETLNYDTMHHAITHVTNWLSNLAHNIASDISPKE